MSSPTPKKKLKRPRKTPAHHKDNAADRLAVKAVEKKGRSVAEANEPVAVVSVRDHWRMQARNDYVMDPDQRSVLWHYQRSDRPYTSSWTEQTFRQIAAQEHWTELREKFWREVEAKVWDLAREKVVAQKLQQIEKLTHIYDHGLEWLAPRVDAAGEVIRYPADHEVYGGLPRFALELPTFDKYVGAMVKLGQQLALLRGEATSRTESVKVGDDTHVISTDPVGSKQSFSQEELRAIARLMVRARQPELADQPEIDIASDGRPDVRMDENDR
jgi:hypothetical protein